jgi:glycosyltransferase involved in cell wall biosynthesis
MKDVLIISHFCRDFSSEDNGRFSYLGQMLSNDYFVEILTSSFFHGTKKPRSYSNMKEWPFRITFISEPPYKKNVCIKRVFSHKTFSINVAKYLKKRKKPDLIYCAVPSLDVASVARKYAQQNGIKFIVDVQDLWPETFRMVFNIPFVSSLFFYPMTHVANKIYSSADEVIAVSKTYAERAMKVNRICNNPTVVFLGTKLNTFDSMKYCEPAFLKPSEQVWMAYIGTLGSSYDLRTVIDALELLGKEKKIDKLSFIVMGRGPLKAFFESYSKNKGIDVQYLGALPYSQMVSQLCLCDFAVNPIRHGAAQSIINKVGDYAAAGLPVINTQENKEYCSLIEQYNAGINCENQNIEQIAEAIHSLYSNVDLRRAMSYGSRKLAETKFDRDSNYDRIISTIKRQFEQ